LVLLLQCSPPPPPPPKKRKNDAKGRWFNRKRKVWIVWIRK
jgi:hypothetical protein